MSFWFFSDDGIDTFDDLAGPPPNLQPPLTQPDSAILNTRDANTLHDFFDHFDTTQQFHFPNPSLHFPHSEHDNGIDSLDFGWPPPRFEGSWSEPQTGTGVLNRNPSFSNAPPQTTMSYDSDVIQGAAFLAQSTSGSANVGAPIFHLPQSLDHPGLIDSSGSRPTSNGGHPGMSMGNSGGLQRPHASLSRHSSSYHDNNNALLTDAYQHAHSLERQEQRPSSHIPGMTFGSDPNFHVKGFMAPPGQISEEVIINGMERTVNYGLHPDTSAENTRPSSPVDSRPGTKPRKGSDPSKATNGMKETEKDTVVISKPRKRLKSQVKIEDSPSDDIDSPPPKQTNGKAGAKRRRASSTHEASSKRSRGQSVSAKTKPNLSEEQKRQNHIASEQKRRHVIGRGFEEMDELVPELRGANHSKSGKLEIAAKFLADLVEGNKLLRSKLAEAGINGFMDSP